MNAKLLRLVKILKILLGTIGYLVLFLYIIVRGFYTPFLIPINEWLLENFGVIQFANAYLSVALFLIISALLLRQVEVYLQTKVN